MKLPSRTRSMKYKIKREQLRRRVRRINSKIIETGSMEYENRDSAPGNDRPKAIQRGRYRGLAEIEGEGIDSVAIRPRDNGGRDPNSS